MKAHQQLSRLVNCMIRCATLHPSTRIGKESPSDSAIDVARDISACLPEPVIPPHQSRSNLNYAAWQHAVLQRSLAQKLDVRRVVKTYGQRIEESSIIFQQSDALARESWKQASEPKPKPQKRSKWPVLELEPAQQWPGG